MEEAKLKSLEGQRLAVVRQRQALEAEHEQLLNSLREFGQEAGALTSGAALNQVAAYTNRLILQDQDLARQEEAWNQEIARQRTVWQEARLRVELLEKLKEKARLEWQVEQDREEQALAEELFLHKWNQERNQG